MKKIFIIALMLASSVLAFDFCAEMTETLISNISKYEVPCETIGKNDWYCSDVTKENGGIKYFVSYDVKTFRITMTHVPPIESKRMGYREHTTMITMFSEFCSYSESRPHKNETIEHNNRYAPKYYKDMFIEEALN